jgi:outer membrane lipoprotein-sorting protein
MNRRAFLLAAAALAFTGPALALDAAKQKDFQTVAGYWNQVVTAKGAFYQTDSNGGVAQGQFWLRKPGRFRFEYSDPAGQLVVADGLTVAVEDKKLETQDRYPLVESPLSLLVDEKIEFSKTLQLTDVQRRAGEIIVFVRSTAENAQGDLAMVFADTDLQLKYWQITDAAGTKVTVQVQNMELNATLDPELFFISGTADERDER